MRATNPWRMLELGDPRRGHRTKWTPVPNMKQEGWCDRSTTYTNQPLSEADFQSRKCNEDRGTKRSGDIVGGTQN